MSSIQLVKDLFSTNHSSLVIEPHPETCSQDREPLTVKMLLMTFGMLRESEAVRLLARDVQHEVRDGRSSLSHNTKHIFLVLSPVAHT